MTIDTISSPDTQASEKRQLRIASAFGVVVSLVVSWMRRSRSRQTLAELTDDQLRDIGISAHEARREARRSVMVRLDGAGLPPL